MKKAHADDKAAKIREAVLGLTAELGLAGLTMKRVAAAAGISPATLYLYHADKEAMICSLYLETKKSTSEAALAGVDLRAGFAQNFGQVWEQAFAYMAAHPSEMIFQQQCYRSPFVDEQTRASTEANWAPVVELILRGQEECHVGPGDPKLYLVMLWGVLQEATQACLTLDATQKNIIKQTAFTFCKAGMAS